MTVGSIPIVPHPPTLVPVKHGSRIVVAAVLAILIAGATAAVALGATSRHDAAPRPVVPAESLSLVVGGIPTPLAIGQEIPVGGDLVARASLSRDNGTARRLELQLSGGDGRPREATVMVGGQMRYMDHGSFVVAAMPAEPGRYVATLPFTMPGEWELKLDIAGVPSPGRITLDLDVTR